MCKFFALDDPATFWTALPRERHIPRHVPMRVRSHGESAYDGVTSPYFTRPRCHPDNMREGRHASDFQEIPLYDAT